jgi:hypothetical protein
VTGCALLDHARHERLDPVHDTEQVHLDHPAPVGVAHLGQRTAHEHARVVAQQMAAAEARPRGVGERVDVGAPRDVAVHRDRLAAARLDLLRDALHRRRLDVGRDDAHARASRCASDALADPATGAGHHRDAPVQLLHPSSSRIVYLRRLAPPSHRDASPRTHRWPTTS